MINRWFGVVKKLSSLFRHKCLLCFVQPTEAEAEELCLKNDQMIHQLLGYSFYFQLLWTEIPKLICCNHFSSRCISVALPDSIFQPSQICLGCYLIHHFSYFKINYLSFLICLFSVASLLACFLFLPPHPHIGSHYFALTFFLLAGIIPPVGDFKVQAGKGKALITHLPWNSSQITTRPGPSDSFTLLPPSR